MVLDNLSLDLGLLAKLQTYIQSHFYVWSSWINCCRSTLWSFTQKQSAGRVSVRIQSTWWHRNISVWPLIVGLYLIRSIRTHHYRGLNKLVGSKEPHLAWFRSYLSGGFQFVHVNEESSSHTSSAGFCTWTDFHFVHVSIR